jgi:4,5-DOPA dioxygenase extradiol
MKSYRMPALFIGHGSPMNIVYDNLFTQSLEKLAKDIPVPECIVVISAHWVTRGTFILQSDEPKQIFDFSGFPRSLYDVKYSPKGNAKLAQIIKMELNNENVKTTTDWGIDHGAWSILMHMYPEASIPVVQISLDVTKNAEYHYELGKKLSFLRDKNVMIIGSGNIIHNLRLVDFDNIDGPVVSWAKQFDNMVKIALTDSDHQILINYTDIPNHELAIPTTDHYLPLLYILGLQTTEDLITFPFEGFQYSSLSMRSLRIG